MRTVVVPGTERTDLERAEGSFQNTMVYMLSSELTELHTMIMYFVVGKLYLIKKN